MSDERRAFNFEMAQSIGRMEGKLDEALKSDRERIEKLEKSQTRQWWFAVAIAPALAVLHAFARKAGVDI